MNQVDLDLVSEVRVASRELVRQFGLMNQNVAGTDLSISSVHAIIEIARSKQLTAKALSELLVLEKSSVSRMVKSLIARGDVCEIRSDKDLRSKYLRLTPQGEKTLADINAFGQVQVSTALGTLDAKSQRTVLKGLTDYSTALRNASPVNHFNNRPVKIAIEEGYAPTILGRVVELLLLHMNSHYGFGPAFESRIAVDLAEFISRLDSPKNQMWRAMSAGNIVGSISIDGEDLGDNLAHLRWFVVSKNSRGGGIGRSLLDSALKFCDKQGFKEIHLWTVKGLDAARNLYEKQGFELVEEYIGDQWGQEVTEQKFVRYKD